MNNPNANFEDESPYEYEAPGTPLSLKKVSKVALGVAGAAASIAFGLQIGGPAIAGMMSLASPQAPALEVGTSALKPITPVKSGVAGLAGSLNGQEQGVQPTRIAAVNPNPADLSSTTSLAANTSKASPGPVKQIQLPNQAGAPTFGNVSSATPSGSNVAAGGSGSSINLRNAYESENEGHEAE